MNEVATMLHLSSVYAAAEFEMYSGPFLGFFNLSRTAWSALVKVLQIGPGGAWRTANYEIRLGQINEFHCLPSAGWQ